jgi:hypothetical protein
LGEVLRDLFNERKPNNFDIGKVNEKRGALQD